MGFMDIVKGAGKMGLDSLSPVQTFKAAKSSWDIVQSGGDSQKLRSIAMEGLGIDEDELKADAQSELDQENGPGFKGMSEGHDASSLKGMGSDLGSFPVEQDGSNPMSHFADVGQGLANFGHSDSSHTDVMKNAISQNLAMMDQADYPSSKSVMSGTEAAEQVTPSFDDNELEA